jgi:hypothetical protein
MLFWLIPGRYRLKYLLVVWSLACGIFGGIFLSKALAVGDMPRVAVYGAAIFFALIMAVLPRVPIFLAGLLVVGGLFGYSEIYLKTQESDALRPTVQTAVAAVQGPARLTIVAPPADAPPVPGKILVWDMTKDRLSDAHYKLPASLRATAQDQAMTLFLIWNIESKQVDTYYKIGEASTRGPGTGWGAYRDTAHLAVVTWPGPRLVGWHTVVGNNPAKRITLHYGIPATSDQHGDLAGPIAQWVRVLPGVPAAPPPAPISLLAFAPLSGASSTTWTEVTAQKEAVRRYPPLGVPNSPLNHAFLARYQQIKVSNPGYLRDPSWPLRLADEVAQQSPAR